MYKLLIIGDLECRDTRKHLRDMELIIELSKISKVTYLTDKPRSLPVASCTVDDLDFHYHYIIILRPRSIPLIIDKMSDILEGKKIWPKIVVRSSGPWYNKQYMKDVIKLYYRKTCLEWAKTLISYVPNEERHRQVKGILPKVYVATLGVSEPVITAHNPYDPNKPYLVDDYLDLDYGKALTPISLVDAPKHHFYKTRPIAIYTGSMKVDNGKAFIEMAEVMEKIPHIELHLFLTTFYQSYNRKRCKGDDAHSLNRLRQSVFVNSPNVIIHHQYKYQDRYQYLYYASCAINLGGDIKALECAAVGLPLVKLCPDAIEEACKTTLKPTIASVETQARHLLDDISS